MNIVKRIDSTEQMFSTEDLQKATKRKDLVQIADEKGMNLKNVLGKIRYEEELRLLQAELVNFQHWVMKNKLRVAIIFEVRDAAGKGGTIKRFVEHLNPRSMRAVALAKPTEVELGQWYFQRFVNHLPKPGEIVFFDRSWYNRAVVEPVIASAPKLNMKLSWGR